MISIKIIPLYYTSRNTTLSYTRHSHCMGVKMPLRSCTIADCCIPADRSIGSCILCEKHFCAPHFRGTNHTCPSRENDPEAYFPAYTAAHERHLSALLSKINVSALQSAAIKARGLDIPCHIPVFDDYIHDPAARLSLVSSQMGGQNCHLDIEFADGITWLARIRLDDPTLPPPEIQARVFMSEVATLLFLAGTKVPAPAVYGFALEGEGNEVGTSYVLMEKMRGWALDWGRAGREGRLRVMSQLADVYLEIERFPLPLTGSLALKGAVVDVGTDEVEIEVGSFAQLPCFETPTQGLGPFRTLEEAYTAQIQQQMRIITNHEVSGLPLDNYLSFLWRLKALPDLIASSVSRNGPFYLRHYDDKGDHILVDEEYNITGIIDWEWASLEAKEFAFSSPCMMWSVGEFYDGVNELNEDEVAFAAFFDARGRTDIGDLVRKGRKWQRFLFFNGGGMADKREEFEALFGGLRKSGEWVDGDEEVKEYEEWKDGFLRGEGAKDMNVQALMRYELEQAEESGV